MSNEKSDLLGSHIPLTAPSRRISLRPLRWWWVGFAVVVVIMAGFGVGWWLWPQSHGLTQSEVAQARTDAIRTGLAAAGGTGAALALLLAVRRQRATEIALTLQDADLAQKERVAATTALDASERRITELYINAVEQLGSDKAPVRIGGLHALERLAQDNKVHRQTIVDVICAYLRMPYSPPKSLPSQTLRPSEHPREDHSEQEYQVRRIAQRILTTHLRPKRDGVSDLKFWPSIEIDLTGAYLMDMDLSECEILTLTCNETVLAGESLFRELHCEIFFIQGARFIPDLKRNTFDADFSAARFKDAWFTGTFFGDMPRFDIADADIDKFFSRPAQLGDVDFREAVFERGARFGRASFGRFSDLTDARVRTEPGQRQDWPHGWTAIPDDEHDGQQSGDESLRTRWWRVVRIQRIEDK